MAEVDQFQRLALGGGDHLPLALVRARQDSTRASASTR